MLIENARNQKQGDFMQTQHLMIMLPALIILLPALALAYSSLEKRWQIAEVSCILALCIALGTLPLTLLLPNEPYSLLNSAPLNAVLQLLISFIALVVIRYAKRNLVGDQDDARFLRWLLLTVAAVLITVASNHLLLFWLAWVGISLSLHQLLMFYPDRPRAALAAHKKFILARVAEVLLAVAFLLLYSRHETAIITEILAKYPVSELDFTQHTAALLLAAVAIIKCAQLPLHGWLIQVVESPTPVSALLHAGVINMGGFLLLLFAPLFSQAIAAQWLVLIIAGLSTLTAALIMMTRISIKVRLAWSTTAQMGLMLIECALGLYELALLHLLAHSCYKAHAFLTAGNEVNRHLQTRLTQAPMPGLQTWLSALLVTAVMVIAAIVWLAEPLPASPWILISMALVMTLSAGFSRATYISRSGAILTGAAILTVYVILKSGTQLFLPNLTINYSWPADVWVSMLLLTLFALYLVLQYRPDKTFSHRLFIVLNAGFYLDEWASRNTLRLWPALLPRSSKKIISEPQEVISS